MNWDAAGAIGEIIGALAVVASLLYLSIQIRRADQTQRAESVRAVLDGFRDRWNVNCFNEGDVADLFAKGLTDFEALDDSEKRRFFYLFAECILQMQQCLELSDAGFLPKLAYDTWIYYTATLIQTPGGKQAWPLVEATISKNVRDILNDYIEQNPDTPSYLELNPIMRFKREEMR